MNKIIEITEAMRHVVNCLEDQQEGVLVAWFLWAMERSDKAQALHIASLIMQYLKLKKVPCAKKWQELIDLLAESETLSGRYKMKIDKEDIKIERILSGITQKDLAERAGISSSYLSMLEAGKRDMPPATARRLMVALGVLPKEPPKVKKVLEESEATPEDVQNDK